MGANRPRSIDEVYPELGVIVANKRDLSRGLFCMCYGSYMKLWVVDHTTEGIWEVETNKPQDYISKHTGAFKSRTKAMLACREYWKFQKEQQKEKLVAKRLYLASKKEGVRLW